MIAEIKQEAERRGITRLCHLTPYRNLVHIATGDGLLSTARLDGAERKVYNQQDLERLDGHPDFVCCSIEFPNGWYLRQRGRDAHGDDLLFPDWVCLCVDPQPLWAETTLFCPRNAAAAHGCLIEAGSAAFHGLFAESVQGAYGRTYTRSPARPAACPTDEQAEVLVYRRIALEDVQVIVVANESQAKRTFLGLTQIGVGEDVFRFVICPEFFSPQTLSERIKSGRRPIELAWDRGSLSNG